MFQLPCYLPSYITNNDGMCHTCLVMYLFLIYLFILYSIKSVVLNGIWYNTITVLYHTVSWCALYPFLWCIPIYLFLSLLLLYSMRKCYIACYLTMLYSHISKMILVVIQWRCDIPRANTMAYSRKSAIHLFCVLTFVI